MGKKRRERERIEPCGEVNARQDDDVARIILDTANGTALPAHRRIGDQMIQRGILHA
jgi:hypothetical protein